MNEGAFGIRQPSKLIYGSAVGRKHVHDVLISCEALVTHVLAGW
jgi:hypothetical protein